MYIIHCAIIIIMTVCSSTQVFGNQGLSCSYAKYQDDSPVVVDDYLMLNCSWDRPGGGNYSDLVWYHGDATRVNISAQNGQAFRNVTAADNGVSFDCIGRNLSSSEEYTCSVLPLATPPNVSLTNVSTGGFILGRDLSVNCEAAGLPHIAGYNWYLWGSLYDFESPSNDRVSREGETITIRNLTLSDNGTVVVCEAFVPSGLKANASVTIELELRQDDERFDDEDDEPSSTLTLWIFIACVAAGGIPCFVLLVVFLAWCLGKSRAKSPKVRTQSRRHIIVPDDIDEAPQSPTTQGNVSGVQLQELLENGPTAGTRHTPAVHNDYDDGTNPPRRKPTPPPQRSLSVDGTNSGGVNAIYVNTAAASTLPVGQRLPTPTDDFVYQKPRHQRKKTEYENVGRGCDPVSPGGLSMTPRMMNDVDLYENVESPQLSPNKPLLLQKRALTHTSSLPNFEQLRK